MSKYKKLASILTLTVLAFGLISGVAFARGPQGRGDNRTRPSIGSVTLIGTAAEMLGVTVPDLYAKMADGATLAEVIDELGASLDPIVTSQSVLEAYLAARAEILQQLVEEGQLTQEQADQMLAHMREQAEEQLSQSWTCPMNHSSGDSGRPGHGGNPGNSGGNGGNPGNGGGNPGNGGGNGRGNGRGGGR